MTFLEFWRGLAYVAFPCTSSIGRAAAHARSLNGQRMLAKRQVTKGWADTNCYRLPFWYPMSPWLERRQPLRQYLCRISLPHRLVVPAMPPGRGFHHARPGITSQCTARSEGKRQGVCRDGGEDKKDTAQWDDSYHGCICSS